MILIKNANIINGFDKNIQRADILIVNDKIEKIGIDIKIQNPDLQTIDASGKYVMPSFTDIHCHLRDPGFEYKEDIRSGSLSAAAGGFTTICCMPNTNPPIDNRAMVAYVRHRAKEVSPIEVLPIGAITRGLNGEELSEIGFMKEEGIVAISDDGKCVMNANLMRNALLYAKDFSIPVISHCEDTNLSEGGQMNLGLVSTMLGLRGIPREAESIVVARDILLAKETKAHLHITHVSTKESVELIRKAKEWGVNVTCDTCPHYISLTEEEVIGFNTNAKVNPPLRTEEDVEALIEAIKEGVIDCITTDHAPHHKDEKNVEFNLAPSGTIGFETAFAVLYTYLVKNRGFEISKLVELLSINPRRIINLKPNTIKENQKANLVIVDPNREWEVKEEDIVSKSKNSVFLGKKLTSYVETVIYEGKILKKDGEIKC
ncbi:dihydroorotase [Caldicellulosiruptor changbaiensis]|uniref:Dihydroorotase n=1 Tax=Caldicellulosiruptor changbaiensis TaxID=1222016 RepID=A0A3T0D5L8_9FIRM|nr:dihydroorotase [Caldicellulosiruptor changbaiensis]AZT90334.1 dihydroorotase [Caldicellulosiruptor changbaiensis]